MKKRKARAAKPVSKVRLRMHKLKRQVRKGVLLVSGGTLVFTSLIGTVMFMQYDLLPHMQGALRPLLSSPPADHALTSSAIPLIHGEVLGQAPCGTIYANPNASLTAGHDAALIYCVEEGGNEHVN